MRAVRAAGFVERTVVAGGHTTAYAEGPDGGPPLVLLHGQASRWQDHLRVLPELARDHHVFAVDVPGHGDSARLRPGEYTNERVAELIGEFLRAVVERPAVLAGHSSGALLALAVAAREPDAVRRLILEDPPLYSSVPPRLATTIGGDLPGLCRDFLGQDAEPDFQRYFLRRTALFELFGPLRRIIAANAVRKRRSDPERPVQLRGVPDDLNMFLRGVHDYDPAFGAAWASGAWYDGFATDEALAAVAASGTPTTLLHTDFWLRTFGSSYNRRGVLMAAMDRDDVDRATRILHPQNVIGVKSGHLVHFVRPQVYIDAVRGHAAVN
ncbi:alpha/beta fold hydrolase [Tsukamurella sp. PLM1]|uniref:alpha/beta fold hydrolase n=1 Tax=Tsukamurella sp. PLM1 TaxID=2929795 RepID=UPI0020BFF51F|nr:alpha/beta hydrolase [Tsukamurella sp. PLM1]